MLEKQCFLNIDCSFWVTVFWIIYLSAHASSVLPLRTTVVAVAAFLDAFQKVADLATNSRGKSARFPVR